MGFIKYASVESLGVASFDGGELRKIAGASNNSYYIDGARKLDIDGLLGKVADKYQISRNRDDYLFEAIRANTTNVPNDNHDAFHKTELLRFDTRLAMPVYMTYIGKPHHLNHKADDPKRARGFILDAHYNDTTPALDSCPTCHSKTAEASARDATGIHCAKCGSVVKDEFVEILVGVDRKKDAALVEGIRSGVLNAGSMGCNCASTVCNVCDHVAHSVHEFCNHIRAGSKGSLWMRKGSSYERTDAESVKKILRQAGYNYKGEGNKIIPVSLVVPELNFEVRKAFENCQGVEFDEYSRVHKPADPMALSIEILRTASSNEQSLEEETRQLVSRAVQARLQEKSMSRAASNKNTYVAVRVNGDKNDLQVAASLEEALERAEVGRRDRIEYAVIKAASLTEAKALAKSAQMLPLEADVQLTIPDGAQVMVTEPGGGAAMSPMGQPSASPGGPGADSVEPSAPGTIEDLTQQDVQPEEDEQSAEEFGMMPPGASAGGGVMKGSGGMYGAAGKGKMAAKGKMPPWLKKKNDKDAEKDASKHSKKKHEESKEKHEDEAKEKDAADSCRYASVYGDFAVEVFDKKAEVETADGQKVMLIHTASALVSDDDKRAFGREVVDSLLNDGLVRTASRYNGIFNRRLADATEGAMTNWPGGYPSQGGGILEGEHHDMKGYKRKPMPGSVTEEMDHDLKDWKRTSPKNVLESRDNDMQDKDEVMAPKSLDGHSGGDDNWEGEPRPYSHKDRTTDHANWDMKVTASVERKMQTELGKAEDRLKRLYNARMDKQSALHAAELAEVRREAAAKEKTAIDRFTKALKIAHRRQALNVEVSPLKAELVDSLTVPRSMGRCASSGAPMRYEGMGTDLALHLVETAWESSAAQDVDGLIQRAAELMQYDDKYLADAQSDLAKQATVIPTVTMEEQMAAPGEVMERSASLREAALDGNLALAPQPADFGASENRVVSTIREVLGGTKVGRILNHDGRSS